MQLVQTHEIPEGPNPCPTDCIQHLECSLCAEPLPGLNPNPSEAGLGMRKNQGVKVTFSSVSATTSGLWPRQPGETQARPGAPASTVTVSSTWLIIDMANYQRG